MLRPSSQSIRCQVTGGGVTMMAQASFLCCMLHAANRKHPASRGIAAHTHDVRAPNMNWVGPPRLDWTGSARYTKPRVVRGKQVNRCEPDKARLSVMRSPNPSERFRIRRQTPACAYRTCAILWEVSGTAQGLRGQLERGTAGRVCRFIRTCL